MKYENNVVVLFSYLNSHKSKLNPLWKGFFEMMNIEPGVLELHEDDDELALLSVYYYGELYLVSWNKILEEVSLTGMVSVGKEPSQEDMNFIADICKDYFYELNT